MHNLVLQDFKIAVRYANKMTNYGYSLFGSLVDLENAVLNLYTCDVF